MLKNTPYDLHPDTSATLRAAAPHERVTPSVGQMLGAQGRAAQQSRRRRPDANGAAGPQRLAEDAGAVARRQMLGAAHAQAPLESGHAQTPAPRRILGEIDVPQATGQRLIKKNAAPKALGTGLAVPAQVLPMLKTKRSTTTLALQAQVGVATQAPQVSFDPVDVRARSRHRALLKSITAIDAGMPSASLLRAQHLAMASYDAALVGRLHLDPHNFMQVIRHKDELKHIEQDGATQEIRLQARALTQLATAIDSPQLLPAPVPVAKTTMRQAMMALAGMTRTDHFKEVPQNVTGGIGAVSVLQLVNGSKYYVTAPIAAGGYKLFCVGMNDHGDTFGVQVMRGTDGKNLFARDAEGRPIESMPTMHPEDIEDEIKGLRRFSDRCSLFDIAEIRGNTLAIVTLFDAGEAGAAVLREDSHRQEAVLMRLFPQMLSQLHELHTRRGAVHRDVKMQNFFGKTSGEVALADFGMTQKMQNQDGLHSQPMGTYIAPELWRNDEYDYAADLWSLGASFGDSLIEDSRRNFLRYQVDKDGNVSPRKTLWYLNMFAAYRRSLFDEADTFMPDRILQPSRFTDFSNYYSELYKKAPVLTAFVLKYLLNTNPRLRMGEDPRDLTALAQSICDKALGTAGSGNAASMRLKPDPKIAQGLALLARTQRRLNTSRMAA